LRGFPPGEQVVQYKILEMGASGFAEACQTERALQLVQREPLGTSDEIVWRVARLFEDVEIVEREIWPFACWCEIPDQWALPGLASAGLRFMARKTG